MNPVAINEGFHPLLNIRPIGKKARIDLNLQNKAFASENPCTSGMRVFTRQDILAAYKRRHCRPHDPASRNRSAGKGSGKATRGATGKACTLAVLLLAIIFASTPASAQTEYDFSSQQQTSDLSAAGKRDEPGEDTAGRKGIDMVFLVDISKSMEDIFDDVLGSLADYVQKALVGDRIVKRNTDAGHLHDATTRHRSSVGC